MGKYSLLVLFLLLFAGVPSWSRGNSDGGYSENRLLPGIAPISLAENEKIKVVATTNMIGDITGVIGGDKIELTVLVHPGQDPHGYEPTPKDLVLVSGSHIIFINGFDLEEQLIKLIKTTADGYIVPVSAGIDSERARRGDPHTWTIPKNAVSWARNIEQTLSSVDPDNRSEYKKNSENYVSQLELMHRYIVDKINTIPEENRKLILDHDSFGYFADEYGFKLVGTILPGFSTGSEPSPNDLAKLSKLIQTENIPAIFIGATAGEGQRRLSLALSEETGTEIKVITLMTGSLSLPGKPGDTYIGYLKYNIDRLVEGLGR